VLGDDVIGLSPREAANRFVYGVKELLEDLELPTSLKQIGIPEGEIDGFADYIFKERQYLYSLPRFSPRKLTFENTRELMHQMYDGTLSS
jgi:alcohol dehydrogenase class IV